MGKHILLLLFLLSICFSVYCQDTYKIGNTEYYSNEYYSNGRNKVKRSSKNKQEFLKSRGYDKVPKGYEVDHITPLSQGGTDSPSNMQLITKEQHKQKTKSERSRTSQSSNYYNYSTPKKNKSSNNTYKTPSSRSNYGSGNSKTIHTGSRGGQYYYNSKGNKTYIKKK